MRDREAARCFPGTLVSVALRPQGGVFPEELRLSDDGLSELVDQNPLVRRVNVAEPIRGAKQQDLGFGHGRMKRVDERNRSTRRDGGRRAPPMRLQALRSRRRRPGLMFWRQTRSRLRRAVPRAVRPEDAGRSSVE